MSDRTSLQPLDGAKVLVVFEVEPGEPADDIHPATPQTVIVTGFMVNGEEVSCDHIQPWVIEQWETLIAEELRNDEREDAREAEWDRYRDEVEA